MNAKFAILNANNEAVAIIRADVSEYVLRGYNAGMQLAERLLKGFGAGHRVVTANAEVAIAFECRFYDI